MEDFISSLMNKEPLNVGGSQTAGSVSFFNNALPGNEAFLASQGLVTVNGWQPGDESCYLMPGCMLFIFTPGHSLHKVYLVNEDDKVSYPEEAVLLVALPRELGMGGGNNTRLRERLLQGEGHVVCALAFKKAAVGPATFSGEMPFPNGEIHHITIRSATKAEVENNLAKGKQARILWMDLNPSMIKACKPTEEPPVATLAVKTGEEEPPAATPLPGGEEAHQAINPAPKKKTKTGLKAQAPVVPF